MFMYNFYACRSQKRKYSVKLSVSFCAFGICFVKAVFKMLVKHATFTHGDPKSVNIQSSCQYIFALWGYTQVKATLKMLVKFTADLECQVTLT